MGSKFKVCLAVLIILLVSLYLWEFNFQAEFGVIDDFQIAEYLGTDQKLSLTEAVPLLKETEVFTFHHPRYRPSYFVLRLIEASVWENNPHLWYLARFLIFLAGILIFFRLISRRRGEILGVLFTLIMLASTCWAQVFNRLGPAEVYAYFGISLFCLGFDNMLLKLKPNGSLKAGGTAAVNAALLILGACFAMGAKENFLLLLLPTYYLLFVYLKAKDFNPALLTAVVVISLYALFIGGVTAHLLSEFKRDIYFNDIDVQSRWSLIPLSLDVFVQAIIANKLLAFVCLFYVLFLVVYFKLALKKDQLEARQGLNIKFLKTHFYLAVLTALFSSQYVFYNGQWPSTNHYNFPGILTIPLILMVLFFAVVDLCEYIFSQKLFKNAVAAILAGLIILTVQPWQGYQVFRKASQVNYRETILLSKLLDKVKDLSRNDSDRPIVVQVRSPWDGEGILSLDAYFTAHGILNPRFVDEGGLSLKAWNSKLMHEMSKKIAEISLEGKNGYQPLAELNNYSQQPVVVYFKGKEVYYN